MRHRSKKIILDRKKAPRKALLGNLASQIILYEKVQTTEAKARAVKPLVEKIVTRAKHDNLANRRLLLARLPIKSSVKKVVEVIAPRYKERQGGYLRIIKMSPRKGDEAKMAQIEFV